MAQSIQVADFGFTKRKRGSHDYLAPEIMRACRSVAGTSLLDLGSGNGWMARELVDAGYQVVGVEPDRRGVALARELVPEASFYEMSVYDDPAAVAEDAFDIVLSTEVIEHLYSPGALVRFASSKLRAGGHLIISAPYHGYLKNLVLSVFDRWDSHHQPWRDGGHIKFWSKRTLSEFLVRDGFEVVRYASVGRVPGLSKSMIVVARKL